MHLGLISELALDYWIGVFLDSNTIRYLKFHEKLQNLCIFEKMYGKSCSEHTKIGQNFDRKKKCTSLFWPKSKIPSIQVVQNDSKNNLYRSDF